MANEYTSILTGGLSDNTVKTMYDFMFEKVLRQEPMYRAWADKGPERPNGPGQTIQLQLTDWFGSASVTAAKTPLNEEQDVDSIKLPATKTVNLTVNEYGMAVTRTKKLKYFSFADVDAEAAEKTAAHCRDVMDELVQDTLVSGTQVLRAAGRASTATVAATDYVTSGDVRKWYTKLNADLAPKFGGFYVAGVHPHVIHDLRQEAGSGGWRLPHEYSAGLTGPLMNGEFGEWEGIRFLQNTRTRKATDGASSANVYRTFIHGRQALAERVVEEPNVVISPVVDKLNRFRTIGWYGVLGWTIFRQESLLRYESSSSVATL